MTDTERLIADLAASLESVRPLRQPMLRALFWLMAEAALFLAVALVHGFRPDLSTQFDNPHFVAEWSAALLTALVTGIATFHVSIPGRESWWVAISVAAIAIWLLSLMSDVVAELRALGPDEIVMRTSWTCVEFLAVVGLLTIVGTMFLVRTGSVTNPVATVMLTGISVTTLASWDLELFHKLDTATELLVWHLSTITAVLAVTRAGGPRLLMHMATMGPGRRIPPN
ncbi:MAG: hypothetical protein B7Z80_09475 [Rhodospirillales bacterium 20-64-7]|nr:MAG: hypothetical protein B7Z80_09475 [Rhodospirillales bacterium 20-64-7]HQT76244.1 DUF1109 domain-containing protein [Rhodopila sp.]